MHLDVTSIAQEHYLSQSLISLRKAGEEKRETDNIFCTIMHTVYRDLVRIYGA